VAGKLTGKRILIVDDDPDIIQSITAVLGDSGAALDTASDGNTAVDLAEKKDPDLVILDIMLPRRSGFLVLERLRQQQGRDGRPRVIMITGNQGKRHQQYAEYLGIDAYLHKPFSVDRLVEIVEQVLTGSRESA
jgi:DNA-binding response OmpR family regulator